jgi:hypothetical protein
MSGSITGSGLDGPGGHLDHPCVIFSAIYLLVRCLLKRVGADIGTHSVRAHRNPTSPGRGIPTAGERSLPPPLGLGALLLDQAGYTGRCRLQAVGRDEPVSAGVRLGTLLDETGSRVALLVMGDRSARRMLKAPGYLDDRAAAFDADVERAVRAGDLGVLQRLDQRLARDLMATGWQMEQNGAGQPTMAGTGSGLC